MLLLWNKRMLDLQCRVVLKWHMPLQISSFKMTTLPLLSRLALGVEMFTTTLEDSFSSSFLSMLLPSSLAWSAPWLLLLLQLSHQSQNCWWDLHIENKSTSFQGKWSSTSWVRQSSNQLLFWLFFSEDLASSPKSSAIITLTTKVKLEEVTVEQRQPRRFLSMISKAYWKRRIQSTCKTWRTNGPKDSSTYCWVWCRTSSRSQFTSYLIASLHRAIWPLYSTYLCSCKSSTWSAPERSTTRSTSSKASSATQHSSLSGLLSSSFRFSARNSSVDSSLSIKTVWRAPSGPTAFWFL